MNDNKLAQNILSWVLGGVFASSIFLGVMVDKQWLALTVFLAIISLVFVSLQGGIIE